MRRISIFIIIIISLFLYNYEVNAKDTLFSINKYKEENFDYIQPSYNSAGKIDGQIAAGSFLKEENTSEETNSSKSSNYQIMLVKYNKEGKRLWTFTYGESNKDSIDYLTYSYDSTGKIDGYLIAMRKTVTLQDNEENPENSGAFLKIDFAGKLVWEKETQITDYKQIIKIIPTYNDNQEFAGYVAIADLKNNESIKNAVVIRYDKDYNITWKKEHSIVPNTEYAYTDLINIYKENKVIGYAIIEKEITSEKQLSRLIKYTKDGSSEILIESLDKYETANLEETTDGYLIYGLTKEVKLNNGEYSYYLINYDTQNKELWETIGDLSVSKNGPLKLITNSKSDKILEYLLLCQNAADASFEVIKFDEAGLFVNKVKKISNEYYTINNFTSFKDVLYFVGHLSCPEDDSCSYNTNSLFLISTEDKVIEVKDNASGRIILSTITIILVLATLIIFKKKRKLNQ